MRLTRECVENLKTPLRQNVVVEVTIDATHDRPYALPGALRVVVRAP